MTLVSRYSKNDADAWRRLYALVGPGRAIDHQEIVSLRDALSSARVGNRMMAASSVRMAQIVDAFDLPVNRATVSQYVNAPIDGYCEPPGKPDGTDYGEATMRGMAEHAEKNPIATDGIGVVKDSAFLHPLAAFARPVATLDPFAA